MGLSADVLRTNLISSGCDPMLGSYRTPSALFCSRVCQLCTSLIAFRFLSSQLVRLDNLFAYWNVNSVLFSFNSTDEALVSCPIIPASHSVSTRLDLDLPVFFYFSEATSWWLVPLTVFIRFLFWTDETLQKLQNHNRKYPFSQTDSEFALILLLNTGEKVCFIKRPKGKHRLT